MFNINIRGAAALALPGTRPRGEFDLRVSKRITPPFRAVGRAAP